MRYAGLIEGLEIPSPEKPRKVSAEPKVELVLPPNYIAVDSPLLLAECLDWLRSVPLVGFDLETTGLEFYRDDIVGMSFFSQGLGYYIPLAHRQALWNASVGLLQKVLVPLLQGGPVKVMHNAKFDRSFVLRHLGVDVSPCEDTLVLSHLWDENESHKLSSLGARYLGFQSLDYSDTFGSVSFSEVALEGAATYAIRDAEATYLLWLELEQRAKDLMPLYRELEMPLQEHLLRIEDRGVQVDTPLLHTLKAEYRGILDDTKARLERVGGVNPSSPKQLSKLFFEEWGFSQIKGNSVDAKVLLALSQQKRCRENATYLGFIEDLLKFREYAKIEGTYVEGIEKRVVEGRIHPSFRQYGTVTGRLSCTDPNLQNIPKDTPERKWRIRDLFVVDEGMVMVVGDYSQIEYRLLAHFSQEPMLMDAYERGEDMHSRTASEVLDIPVEQLSAESRAFGKTLNFGIVYGLGPQNLAASLKVRLEEAKEYLAIYFKRLPQVVSWRDAVMAEVSEQGYVETILGRRRRLPKIYSGTEEEIARAERQGPNAVIQGSAADIMKSALVLVDQDPQCQELGLQVLFNVHDEIVAQVPEERAGEALERMTWLCEETPGIELTVPLVFDGKVGGWAEK